MPTGNQTVSPVPLDVTDQDALRQFLIRLVIAIDVIVGYREGEFDLVTQAELEEALATIPDVEVPDVEVPDVGVSNSHSLLFDLTNDDHTHYHTNARGDIRYYLKAAVDALLEKKAPAENGFVDRSDSTLSFVDGTRTFTITPTGASFDYYHDKTKYTKSSAENIVIDDTEGLHFIYYNGTTLSKTTSFTEELITLYAFVAVIYWNATDNEAVFFGDERHGNIMDSQTHRYRHSTAGADYASGFALGNMDVDGSGDNASAAQFSVSDGVIWDEDIEHVITDGSPQELSTIAEIPLFYRTGANGEWRKIDATQYPITTTGTGRAAWNEWTGTTWQLSEVDNNDFVLVHYLATNDIDNPIIGLVGQDEYNTTGAARAGAEVEYLALAYGPLGSLTPEFVAIATVIWQTSNGNSNAVQSRIRSTDDGFDYVDWRSVKGGVSNSSAQSISASSSEILEGTATTGQDMAAAKGTVHQLEWDLNTNDVAYINAFTDGDTDISIIGDQELNLTVSAAVLDDAADNRTILGLRVRHENSSGTEIYTYWLDGLYLRDSSASYDSGLLAGSIRLFVSDTDVLIAEVVVLDTSSTTGSPLSTVQSKIKLDRIVYS